MKYDEYMDSLLEQIENDNAKVLIYEEIENHIEEQKEAYMLDGVEEEKALAESVKQMGNPIEVGEKLNKIHRPEMPKSILWMTIGLIFVGIIIQACLFVTNGAFKEPSMGFYFIGTDWDSAFRPVLITLIYNLIGIGAMLIIVRLDYTFIGRYPYSLWLVYVAVLLFGYFTLDGMYSDNLELARDSYVLSLIFPILFAGLIYANRNKKVKGMLSCIAMMFATVAIFKLFYESISVSIESFFICMVVLAVAVKRKIFDKKIHYQWGIWFGIWLVLVVAIICVVFSGKMSDVYQGNGIEYATSDYDSKNQLTELRENAKEYTLFGTGTLNGATKYEDITSNKYVEEFILSSIFSWFGIIPGTILLLLIGYFLWKLYRMSLCQRNRIGLLVGVACASSLALRIIICTFLNFGVGFYYTTMFPLLGFGLFNSIYTGVFMGLLICIGRNYMVLSENHNKGHEEWINNRKSDYDDNYIDEKEKNKAKEKKSRKDLLKAMGKKSLVVVVICFVVGNIVLGGYYLFRKSTGGNISDVKKTQLSESELYSEKDVKAAVKEVEKDFQMRFSGCKLVELRYDDKVTISEQNHKGGEEYYKDSVKGRYEADDVIVIRADFRTGSNSWQVEPRETNSDETIWFTLVRKKGNKWNVVDCGEG